MIKVFVAIPRRADISDAQFHAHWREPHGRLALNIKPMRRYVQSHRVPHPSLALSAGPYEGFAEVWLDDLTAALNLGNDPDYQRYLRPDEPNFCDQAGLKFLFTEEDVALAGPLPGEATGTFKLIQLIRRPASLTAGEFDRIWGRGDGESAAAAALRLVRHVRCRCVPETVSGITPAFDAVRELWWPDARAFDDARQRAPSAWESLVFAEGVDRSSVIVAAVREERFL